MTTDKESGPPTVARLLINDEKAVYHNARAFVWPDGSTTLKVADKAIFRAPGWEDRPDPFASKPLPATPEECMAGLEREGKWLSDGKLPPSEYENRLRAVRRAKARLRALARANEFSYFVTLTLSPQKVDRYDDSDICRRLTNWLRNAVARFGLTYCLVPERHKDGALHFHGFINGALDVVDSGTLAVAGHSRPVRPHDEAHKAALLASGAHVVYNLPQWRYGFTTAIGLYGDRTHAIAYVCKYIGKSMNPATGAPERIGGRWVYSGGNLKKPREITFDLDFDETDELGGFVFDVPQTGVKVRIAELGEVTHGNEKDNGRA